MKFALKRLKGEAGRIAAIAVLLLAVVIRIIEPGFVEIGQLRGFDLLQRLFPRQQQTSQEPVAIVDIDDTSLAQIGQWPWPRTVIAQLVTKLAGMGARVIAFDVVFAEPDRLSPARLAASLPGLDPALKAALAARPDNDTVLAAAMRTTRVVLGQAASPEPGLAPAATPATPLVVLGEDPRPSLFSFPGLVPPIPALAEAARGQGLITIIPESDGIIRRVPLVLSVAGQLYPALSAEILRVLADQPTLAIRADAAGVRELIVGTHVIPTDERGRLWVRYARHRPGANISASDVIAGSLDPKRIADKIILIGSSAAGLRDLRATPLDAAIPGVEIHAQILDTILDRSFVTRSSWTKGAEVLLILGLGLIMIAMTPKARARRTFLILIVLSGLIGAGTIYAFVALRIMLDGTMPLATAALLYSILLYSNYSREETERRRIRDAFRRYLAPAVVDQLAQDRSKLVLGGELRSMTIMFCDVRGFTSISERFKTNPGGLTRLMNRFLTPMTETILRHGGTIDKYIGDCVMAFWNAPLDDPKHETHACEAALAMLRELEKLNAELRNEPEWLQIPDAPGAALQLQIGIGINSGDCIVGNIGSAQRFDYSVLGDAVNLAARFETQSKEYGVPVVVGERTQARARNVALLELDLITARGKRESSRIFTLLGGAEMLDSPEFQTLRLRHQAMLASYRAGDWQQARDLIQQCRRINPGLDRLYDLYLERTLRLEANGTEEPEESPPIAASPVQLNGP